MSIAQPSRFATVDGMRALMSARTTSGSMGGSRGGVELQATEKYGSRSQERQESRNGTVWRAWSNRPSNPILGSFSEN
jgi:hypothetical protein